jgi:septum formation protein
VQVVPSQLPEHDPDDDDFTKHVRVSAASKCHHVAKDFPDQLVLGADTLVVCDGIAMGKPAGERQAREMLQRLSGCWHHVITGFCIVLLMDQIEIIDYTKTDVRFYALSDSDIDGYIQTGEPFDKAGGYGIQGLGARFVREVRGCYFNVVGLPLGTIWQTIKSLREVSL